MIKSLQQLFRTKSLSMMISDSENKDHQLKKVLGPVDLIILGIGVIIGAGIFTTIGSATAGDWQGGGPWR